MMNKPIFCLSLFLLIVLSACQKRIINNAELRIDADNFSAPLLDPGTYEAAVLFDEFELAGFEGRDLIEVAFYILEKPTECEVRIYGEGTDNEPGELLYSEDITLQVDAEKWNRHELPTPIEITGADLWLVIRVRHSSILGSVGCDPGPADNNGDWLLPDGEETWTSLRDFTDGDVNINWNIRGLLED